MPSLSESAHSCGSFGNTSSASGTLSPSESVAGITAIISAVAFTFNGSVLDVAVTVILFCVPGTAFVGKVMSRFRSL